MIFWYENDNGIQTGSDKRMEDLKNEKENNQWNATITGDNQKLKSEMKRTKIYDYD